MNPLSLENLFKNAFERTKERFLSYFLVVLISVGFGIGVAIAALLLIGLAALIYFLTKLVFLVVLVSIIFLLLFLTLVYYFGVWIQLTLTQVVISPEKITVGEAFSKVKPLIWGYVKLAVLMSLFFLGLMPLGFLSLFVILIVWSFWSIFTVFVYLEHQPPGLKSLWTSKAIVSQKFWAVAGRMFLVQIAVMIISFTISSGAERNPLFALISFAFSLVTGPFLLSFSYEIYKNLPVPENIPTPKVWIALSIIGLIIMIVLPVVMAGLIISLLPQIMQNLPKNLPKDFPFSLLTPTPPMPKWENLPGAI